SVTTRGVSAAHLAGTRPSNMFGGSTTWSSMLTRIRSSRFTGASLPASDGGLDDGVHARRAAVGYARLAPHLHRERHVDERVAQPQQTFGVIGQRVEIERVEVRRRRLQPGEGGVVERLQL